MKFITIPPQGPHVQYENSVCQRKTVVQISVKPSIIVRARSACLRFALASCTLYNIIQIMPCLCELCNLWFPMVFSRIVTLPCIRFDCRKFYTSLWPAGNYMDKYYTVQFQWNNWRCLWLPTKSHMFIFNRNNIIWQSNGEFHVKSEWNYGKRKCIMGLHTWDRSCLSKYNNHR